MWPRSGTIPKLGLWPQSGEDYTMLVTFILAFAIDGHGGGNQYLAHLMFGVCQKLQERCPTQGIHLSIVPDPVHRLAHTHHSRQVKDDIHPLQSPSQLIPVTHIPLDKLSAGIQVRGQTSLRTMHLGHQCIVDPHVVSPLHQGIYDKGPDKASAPCNQHLLRHRLCRGFCRELYPRQEGTGPRNT